MAKIIERTERHYCHEEIAAIDDNLYFGSVVECSCGKRFVKKESQRDGAYWEEQR